MRCPDDINVDACPLGNADEFFINRRIAAGKRPLSPSSGRLPRPEPDGRSVFQVKPYLIVFPGIFLSLTVLAVNLVGDGLRDALDPRLARRI